jgi:hypothetical protein
VVKSGGRLVRHARCYWLLLAESHLTWRLFAGMLGKVAALLLASRDRRFVERVRILITRAKGRWTSVRKCC